MNSSNILASIITIGDELLIGQTIDTNSPWMAQELNAIGIWVHRRVAVGDVWDDIRKALDEEAGRSTIILITGGLGPTADDITKPLLCDYFGGRMVVDEGALANVKHIFEVVLKRPMIERNLKQAEVPDVCTVLQNRRGTAPGMWFEKEGCIFVSLPGVPNEMKGLMANDVLPRLQGRYHLPPVIHRTLLTAGIGESFLAERILDFENALPSAIKLAYLPHYGMVRLRLTARGNEPGLEAMVEECFQSLKGQLEDVLVIDSDRTLQEVVGNLLKERGMTMSTAESCTGGYIAHLITSIAGSSAYFKGSVVSYANGVKTGLLGVEQLTLSTHGAVSEETVKEMALGANRAMGTDFALATSGVMGPGGGTPDKPVGMVWIAVAFRGQVSAQSFRFRFDRARNMELTAQNGLNMLRKVILSVAPGTGGVSLK
jgi:nicotinamide-nucleotide amidase